jgi:hypothetical protein
MPKVKENVPKILRKYKNLDDLLKNGSKEELEIMYACLTLIGNFTTEVRAWCQKGERTQSYIR